MLSASMTLVFSMLMGARTLSDNLYAFINGFPNSYHITASNQQAWLQVNTSWESNLEHKHFAVKKISIQTFEDMNSVKSKEDRATNVKWVLNGILECSARQNIFEKLVIDFISISEGNNNSKT